jgi:predicted DNA-binding protein (UPF0251 family)
VSDSSPFEHQIALVAKGVNSLARALTWGESPQVVEALTREVLGDKNAREALPSAAHADDPSLRLYRRLIRRNRTRLAALASINGASAALRDETHSLRSAKNPAEAVAKLPLDMREALLLVVLIGASYGEVASILEISRSDVIARVAEARRLMNAHAHPDALPRAASDKRQASHLRVIK